MSKKSSKKELATTEKIVKNKKTKVNDRLPIVFVKNANKFLANIYGANEKTKKADLLRATLEEITKFYLDNLKEKIGDETQITDKIILTI